ncbi:winged helix-turn-helix domain-containing protein [Bradyrhizobium sp. Bra64]|uniref:ATP-binding protein n=1 Tax=Bradyrhizobium sp. Bra64 TaxID=2926009 RepID=UPI002119B425|nr:winged helix-turn-helix domain-containing protein [Bradyrhizobium sp. Bra64]
MKTPVVLRNEILSFGPFRVTASERLLTKDGVAVELGARAFDILIALLSRPAEIISKHDLIARVWPGVTVEEVSLRFHVASLRKALGDGKDGVRYITTSAGLGYGFVAPVLRSVEQTPLLKASEPGFQHANLPVRLSRMIDREEDLESLSVLVDRERFVTIVGSGGVGKTTVAVVVGHQLIDRFTGAVLFVDLSMLNDSDLVATVIASLLGLSVQSHDATSSLVAYLRDKRILLILDTCEHLIEAVAVLASLIFASAPQIHILATSRETLQAQGEHVYRLEPLACPPDGELSAEVVKTFPATQLFLDRALASGAQLDFSDAEAATVAEMCRKLDGVALAIELTARRIEAYGVHQTAALLDQRLTLSWSGLRGAPARQKTLQATLDWSYRLLSEVERVVLRRLAVFVGSFTIDAALWVATTATVDRSLVLGAIDGLVAKSMIAVRPAGTLMRYQLLDTTRAYARQNNLEAADFADLHSRHANYYRQWLETTGLKWPILATAAERAPHFIALNNVRAGLEWCFGAGGDADLGVRLAAAAAPVFWAMSLLPECHRWSLRAIQALDETSRGSREEMHLQAGLATSFMNVNGKTDDAKEAFHRSLAIAEELGDSLAQMGLLGILHVLHVRGGDFKTAFQYAQQASVVAAGIDDATAKAFAHSLLGRAFLFEGDVANARLELEAAVRHQPNPEQISPIYLAADRHYRPGIQLARTLWLQGYPAQSVERVHNTLKEVTDHPVALTGALTFAIGVFFWTGDLASAEAHIDWFLAHAEAHSLGPNAAVGRGLRAQLAIYQGDAETGVETLRGSMARVHAARHGLLVTEFNISLARGLMAIGQFTEAMTLIQQAIDRVDAAGDTFSKPELLRLSGRVHLSKPEADAAAAESCLLQSLELSRRQGTLAWELRTAIDLAELFANQGQPQRGRMLLEPVFLRFTEGFETADLAAAERLLAGLR